MYVGVSYVYGENRDNPQYIVYEIEAIKEFYSTYGIDTLLNEYLSWYYHKGDSIEWTIQKTKKTILWNDMVERYIIYLALRENYIVYIDDESGYLCVNK